MKKKLILNLIKNEIEISFLSMLFNNYKEYNNILKDEIKNKKYLKDEILNKIKEIVEEKNNESNKILKKIFNAETNNKDNIFEKLKYLTDGFTGRDLRNINKIMFKKMNSDIAIKDYDKSLLLNTETIKCYSYIKKVNENIEDNLITNSYNPITIATKIKDYFIEIKDYILNKLNKKKIDYNAKLNDIFTNVSVINIDEFEEMFDNLDKDKVNVLIEFEKMLDENKIENKQEYIAEIFLCNKNLIHKLLEKLDIDINNVIDGIFDYQIILYTLNKYYEQIINTTLIRKIIILNYILNNININTYFEAIEEYIIGKDKEIKITDELLERIAVHELGHAINGHINGKKVLKVAIGSKNMSLGQTFSIKEKEELLKIKEDFFKDIIELLGGRAAEKIILGDYSTGASNDYERATKLATSFFLNNMEYITKDGKKLKIGVLVNPNDVNMKDYLNEGIRKQVLEYSKIMIEELEQEAENNINNNRNLINEYTQYLLKNKILINKDLEEFLSKIK